MAAVIGSVSIFQPRPALVCGVGEAGRDRPLLWPLVFGSLVLFYSGAPRACSALLSIDSYQWHAPQSSLRTRAHGWLAATLPSLPRGRLRVDGCRHTHGWRG